MTAVVLEEDSAAGKAKALAEADALIQKARSGGGKEAERRTFVYDGKIVEKSDTLEGYGQKVEKIKEYIRERHIFQTVLSQRWTIETGQEGFGLYKKLRELNPSPYLYYFNFGEFEVIGSSPEMIVKQQGGKVFTCPIAGTRKRGKDAAEDEALKQDLLSDEKERAEHVMLVDLARNDMGKISEFGTVKVTQFMEVQNYSHVMHIVSMVEGRKKGSFHPLDLAASFLPAGTLSGAPKFARWRLLMNWRAAGGAYTAELPGMWILAGIWISALQSVRWSKKEIKFICRQEPGLLQIRSQKWSTRNAATR